MPRMSTVANLYRTSTREHEAAVERILRLLVEAACEGIEISRWPHATRVYTMGVCVGEVAFPTFVSTVN